jgi:hypothetical protein
MVENLWIEEYFIPCSSEIEAAIDLAVEFSVVDVELERLRENVLNLFRKFGQVTL